MRKAGEQQCLTRLHLELTAGLQATSRAGLVAEDISTTLRHQVPITAGDQQPASTVIQATLHQSRMSQDLLLHVLDLDQVLLLEGDHATQL